MLDIPIKRDHSQAAIHKNRARTNEKYIDGAFTVHRTMTGTRTKKVISLCLSTVELSQLFAGTAKPSFPGGIPVQGQFEFPC